MRYFKLLFMLPLFFLLSCSNTDKNVEEVDVCIYGGTSAGVIAAYTAKQAGKSVLLIEPGNHLGGMSSGGLGFTDIGNKYVVQGLARDFYRRLGSHYGKLEQWIFEPSVAEAIFNDYVKRADVDVLYENRLLDVKKEGNRITEIIVENSKSPNTSTNKKIKAKVFIDCSYEGDLMAKANVSYIVGREDNKTYNETYNGSQLLNGHQFPDGIDPYKVKGDSTSGLIWGISDKAIQPNGTGDKKVQAYNYRVALTNRAENLVPITKPDNYDPARYELLVRLKEKQPWNKLYDIFIWQIMPNAKTDINNFGGFSTDMIGANWNYPEASYEDRAKIVKEHEDYTKGLFYFLGNDERIPEHIRKEMQTWGYPKDEYTDNGNWSHQLYIRESRRMIGEKVMTQHHCQGKEIAEDAIAWAAYTMDSHNCDRHVVNGMVKNEGNVEVGGFPPYPISYKSITPKKEEACNLLVPVCMSASHIAYGSIRMEPVFMVMAQSAAVAACHAIDNNTDVQNIDIKKLQEIIANNPLADGSTPEILVDNDSKTSVTTVGNWSFNYDTYRGYGSNFFVDDSKGKDPKSIKYTPNVVSESEYDIYIYFPKLENGSNKTAVTISDGKSIEEKTIFQSDVKVEGQTLGEWVKLGRYNLPEGKNAYVEISNKGADNVVAADAVLFLPVRK
ncbi:FAD-dependent oxidoreductase [Dysgonomonas sp. 520]|uniref:FAD-dependent oxidoreductase n=1 Tax=Dysgonomonas sp. 520 TaxID=2302931 RepID=UPI0013CF7201|nr:FAD-dependent oxidoreductase [Dysgonomonas sp. 520]NDW10775.1 FAD-dependent oxidoreductase [Dysgonomonas sp. 520]